MNSGCFDLYLCVLGVAYSACVKAMFIQHLLLPSHVVYKHHCSYMGLKQALQRNKNKNMQKPTKLKIEKIQKKRCLMLIAKMITTIKWIFAGGLAIFFFSFSCKYAMLNCQCYNINKSSHTCVSYNDQQKAVQPHPVTQVANRMGQKDSKPIY